MSSSLTTRSDNSVIAARSITSQNRDPVGKFSRWDIIAVSATHDNYNRVMARMSKHLKFVITLPLSSNTSVLINIPFESIVARDAICCCFFFLIWFSFFCKILLSLFRFFLVVALIKKPAFNKAIHLWAILTRRISSGSCSYRNCSTHTISRRIFKVKFLWGFHWCFNNKRLNENSYPNRVSQWNIVLEPEQALCIWDRCLFVYSTMLTECVALLSI